LIGWQLSIWNCYKPSFSSLYNCQLLCLWSIALSTAADVFPQPYSNALPYSSPYFIIGPTKKLDQCVSYC
jgi:hypothetical protein